LNRLLILNLLVSKGLQSYVNCDIPGICTPFMVLVDYRGFRLIAMSILPIEKSSLVITEFNYQRVCWYSEKQTNKQTNRYMGQQMLAKRFITKITKLTE